MILLFFSRLYLFLYREGRGVCIRDRIRRDIYYRRATGRLLERIFLGKNDLFSRNMGGGSVEVCVDLWDRKEVF